MEMAPLLAQGAAGRPFPRETLVRVGRLAVPLVLLLIGAAFLRETGTPTTAAASDALIAPIDTSSLVGAGLVVAGLLAAMPLAFRKLAQGAKGRGSIDVVETRTLGSRRALLVVEVDGRRLLVGASEHGLSLVTDLSRPAQPFPTTLASEVAGAMTCVGTPSAAGAPA